MRTLLVSSSAVLLLAACSSSKESGPTPLEVYSTGVPGEAAATRSQKITAKVLAVDTASRRVTLQAEDGHTEMISCPPEVKRFNEIAVGDNVVVQVQEGILFEYQPPGSAFVPPAAAVTGARTGSDQPPVLSPTFALVKASVELAQCAVATPNDLTTLWKALHKVGRAMGRVETTLERAERYP